MYVIYSKDTTKIVENVRYQPYRVTSSYKTHAAAQAAVTRMQKKYLKDNGLCVSNDGPLFDYGIAEAEYYYKHIERTEIVYSIFDTEKKNPIRQSVNTPYYCSPSSESYWSM